MVHAIQIASPTMNIASRNPPPDTGGNCASFIAMPAWNGFVGPKALPIIAAPALMAITTRASTPRP